MTRDLICPYCGKLMESGASTWEAWCETPECVQREKAKMRALLRVMIEREERAQLAKLQKKYGPQPS